MWSWDNHDLRAHEMDRALQAWAFGSIAFAFKVISDQTKCQLLLQVAI
jgi:hypothetical protein